MFDRTPSQEGNPVVMAYPQPGPYPVYSQYPGQTGVPAKPPIPRTVQYAFYLMLAGPVLELVSVIATIASRSKVDDYVATHNLGFDAARVDTAVNIIIVGVVFGGLVHVGLWIWMAFANRAGKNWARITSTVFFGFACLSLVAGLAASTVNAANTLKLSPVSTIVGVLIWLVGLATIVLLWNKESAPHFNRPQYGAPGYPYPYPYPYPNQYGMPGQQPMPPVPGQPTGPQVPQAQPDQPTDPWSNPPQQ